MNPAEQLPFTGGHPGLADNVQQKRRCCPEVPQAGGESSV
jgi:hypothetical protein